MGLGLSIKLKIILVILFLVLATNTIIASYIVHLMKEDIITPERIVDVLHEKEVLVVIISTFVLVLLITILFSVTLVEPVDQLIIGTQLVAEGKLDYQITKQSDDEIGRLVDAFNEMIRKLRKSIEKETKSTEKAQLEKTKGELIVNSMADGVLVTDNEHNLVLINPAAEKIFNINAPAVLSKHIVHLNKFGFSKVFYDILDEKERTKGKRQKVIVHEMHIKTPEEKIITITVSPLKNESGSLAGTVMVVQDVTKIREVENMKNEFVGIVSHELRTPLTSILGYATLLQNKKLGEINEKQQRATDIIVKESNLLHNLINDLLDLSKLESGKVQLRNEMINLIDSLKQCPALHISREKNISLTLLAPKNFPDIYIDKGRIMQVFTNLLSNAAKFTPPHGKITIRLQDKKDSIRVSVSDTGMGIAKKHIPLLFNKFYQVESHLRRNKGGTGLGLSIVKEIIDLYGGVITVTSKLNKGTTFSFTLPKLNPDEEKNKEQKVDSENKPRSHTIRTHEKKQMYTAS